MEIRNSFLKRILSYFIRGLVLVAPLYATALIIWTGIEFLDNIIPINVPISGRKDVYLPGLGGLIIIGGIVLLGFFFSTVVPQSFLRFTESIMRRIPLVSLIYYSIKDLILAFVGDKKKFNQPVLVTVYKDTGIKKIGFITQTDLSHLHIEEHVAVYMPFSYSLSGELFIVPAENVTVLDTSATDVMKMVISGGVSVKISKEESEIDEEQ
ncbi:hypothetical protein DSL64_11890 [Dyadobacter luteus]|jgi:uncharacterized membrane protein|uniref:DUF502 domain-containing protein n=1 Tax=Dyadobacter luteus TaxID=2259619 RepID=A0A3D8YCV0_9BACT|nr:DUF502 domain-containing protein [Dyadobacter luteus]REA61656.1 hypothetical protein DSL64_11890 [Dyadobacter luteus]